VRAFAAAAAAGLIALLPLATAATRPPVSPATAPLAAWLEAHGLTYGIAGYWDASIVTLQSGNRLQIRAVDLNRNIDVPGWETNTLWYDASRYDARFAVADYHGRYPAARFEHFLGKPAATYPVASWLVLVYRTNLLPLILPRPGSLLSRPRGRSRSPREFEVGTAKNKQPPDSPGQPWSPPESPPQIMSSCPPGATRT
jgi:hypothetical protein